MEALSLLIIVTALIWIGSNRRPPSSPRMKTPGQTHTWGQHMQSRRRQRRGTHGTLK